MTKQVSPPRQRMIDDMTIRNMSPESACGTTWKGRHGARMAAIEGNPEYLCSA